MSDYHDSKLSVDDKGLTIGWYYPWGSKHVPLGSVQAVERTDLTLLGGRWRIWGSTTLRYWANLDPGRPSKTNGFILNLGRAVRPFVTPDDPDGFEAALRSHLPQATFSTTTGSRHVI